jgi:hypothetical protein
MSSHLSATGRDRVFWKNANAFYRLSERYANHSRTLSLARVADAV